MHALHDLDGAYRRAEELIAAGDLARAADLCREMMAVNPEYPYGYHLMASLFSATGTYDRALTFAQLATQMAPDVCAFHLQKGRVLYSLGEYEAAALAFTAALNIEPHNPIILLLLANTFTRRCYFDEAQGLFLKARQLSDIPEIDEQEGLCHLLQGNHAEAESLFNRLIARCPDYTWGHVHKGRLLMDGTHNAQAEACMARALKLDPNLYEALYAMAILHDWQGQAEIAIRYAMDAIRVKPMAWECHAFLGSILVKDRHAKEAEQVLEQALALRPVDAYVWQLLIESIRQQKRVKDVQQRLRQALSKHPEHPILKFFLLLAIGQQPSLPPQAFITSFYDGFAEQYDHHQRNVVSYSAPEKVATALRKHILLPSAPRRLLDIGCGTGLSVDTLADLAAWREGVDLSARMLERARYKQLYHALHLHEAVAFMLASSEPYHLVSVVDMLPSFGELTGFIQAARNVLTSDGILALTIEKDDRTVVYRAQPNGRFKHHPAYVTGLLHNKGYDVLHQEDFALRIEASSPTIGTLIFAKKQPLH